MKQAHALGAPLPPKPFESLPDLILLNGVTGYAQPGVLTALMGASGAGKTTLMDVLAGRKTIGQTTGDIYVNGRLKNQDSWKRVTGYVEQFDIHTPILTVRDSVYFSARMRLPAHLKAFEVQGAFLTLGRRGIFGLIWGLHSCLRVFTPLRLNALLPVRLYTSTSSRF
jgi:ABC-type uncharacterized transport system YnjBCD ATPase subunit